MLIKSVSIRFLQFSIIDYYEVQSRIIEKTDKRVSRTME